MSFIVKHFLALKPICHSFCQLTRVFKSSWKEMWSNLFWISLYNTQSSANNLTFEFVIWQVINPNTIKSYKKLSPKHTAHGVVQSTYPICRHGKACLSKQPPWRAAGDPRLARGRSRVRAPGPLRVLFFSTLPSFLLPEIVFRTFPTNPAKVLGLIYASPGTAAVPAPCLAVRPNQPRPRSNAHHRRQLAGHGAWENCWSRHEFYFGYHDILDVQCKILHAH